MANGGDAEAPEEGRRPPREASSAASDAKPARLAGENAEQAATIAEQKSQIAKLTTQIAEQKSQIAKLTAQVAKLTEVVNQNSKNSHLPPSSDGPGKGKGKGKGGSDKPRGKSGRKRGGQKGHRGCHRRLLPPDRVDTFVNLFPKACAGCADVLPHEEDADPSQHQSIELRDHRPHVTEHRLHEVKCGRCGTWTRAPYDPEVIPRFTFGPCLTAVVVLLTGTYHLSRRKTVRLLRELYGLSLSVGTVSSMEKRASDALKSSHEEALREVQYAGVKHSDATSWTQSGKLMSLWVLATTAATFYRILDNGRRETIRPMFGPRLGILVSDRATVFTFWTMALRQVCHAHLLRKFVAFSEQEGVAGEIGRALLECVALLFEYWHGYKDGHLTRQELQHWIRPVQRAMEQLLERGEKANAGGMSGSCADILAHREALWTFVHHEGVEPTNNHGELELRDFVLWRRRSFGSRSDRGDRFAERVMTVVRTARKQGQDVLDFLARSLTAYFDKTPPPSLIGATTAGLISPRSQSP